MRECYSTIVEMATRISVFFPCSYIHTKSEAESVIQQLISPYANDFTKRETDPWQSAQSTSQPCRECDAHHRAGPSHSLKFPRSMPKEDQ